MARLAVALMWFIIIGGSALAQSGLSPFANSARPTMGATGGLVFPPPPPTYQASGNNDILRHRDFTGRPCLDVSGYAQPQTIDPNLYDQTITVVNHCPQRIGIQVCYYQSQDCIPMQIPGNERKEAILGTMPAEKDFRFEFREKF